ncbi:histamine H2 receptor-like [Anneissia japonica]|uniref:histamine H2 receptor-like n=1 Tax=Anneissia japonica TaxID=1529436 RepID=UPI001425743D|nr:histamine H2 receptor-like [Anneissia japonica]XP_033112893.1 histamine H2 receptor-like [Anneissia japonica]
MEGISMSSNFVIPLQNIKPEMLSLAPNLLNSANTTTSMMTLDSDVLNASTEDGVQLELYNIFTILIVIPFVFLTLFGNVMVMLAVMRYKRLQIPSNYILVNLAIADIIVSILMLFICILQVFMYKFDTGKLCNIPFCIITIACSVSLLSLSMIAYDRYLALVKPLKYTQQLTSKRVAVYCLIMWLYSIVVAILPLLHSWPIETDYKHICNYLDIGYTILIQLGVTFVPAFLLILFAYINVWSVARHHSRAISAVQLSLFPGLFSNRNYHMFKGNKYSRTLTLIFGVYSFTWVLYVISIAMDIIFLKSGRYYEFYKYTGILILVNCCANPLVYAYRNQDFKAAFRRILKTKLWCLFKRGRHSDLERRPSRASDQLSRTNSLCTNLQQLQLLYQFDANTTITIPASGSEAAAANGHLGLPPKIPPTPSKQLALQEHQIPPKKVVAL